MLLYIFAYFKFTFHVREGSYDQRKWMRKKFMDKLKGKKRVREM